MSIKCQDCDQPATTAIVYVVHELIGRKRVLTEHTDRFCGHHASLVILRGDYDSGSYALLEI